MPQTTVTFNCICAAQSRMLPSCVTSINVTVEGTQDSEPSGFGDVEAAQQDVYVFTVGLTDHKGGFLFLLCNLSIYISIF